jgi:hypothetical protein
MGAAKYGMTADGYDRPGFWPAAGPRPKEVQKIRPAAAPALCLKVNVMHCYPVVLCPLCIHET